MDWRKFFDIGSDDKDKKPREKFNFKKFEDEEDEDDWFDLETFFNEFQNGSGFQFHGFPRSMMKQFREVIEAMKDVEENDDLSAHERTERLQKFYDNYSDFKQKSDQDLDGKMYANQLDSILKKINPEIMQKRENDIQDKQRQQQQSSKKLSDEDKIMDLIHGTYKEDIAPAVKPKKRTVQKAPFSPHHFSALPPFPDYSPPASSTSTSKSWGRTVISIRNADGSYETRKIEKTPDGNTKTTITKKDAEGNSSTQSFVGDEPKKGNSTQLGQSKALQSSATDHNERHLTNYDGYKIPTLW